MIAHRSTSGRRPAGRPAGRTASRTARALAVPLLLALVAGASAPGYLVRAGDSLWAIARSHHTTVAELKRINHLSGDTILIGQLLRLPGNGRVAPTAPRPPATTTTRRVVYVVRPGDALSRVCTAHHVSMPVVARVNHLAPSLMIYIGQRLVLPVQVPAHASQHGAAHHRATPRRPVPASTVRAVITAEARRQGVDPALVLALSWQESGFNQAMVSSTGAVGVMQLMPGTSSWLADDVLHRRLDPHRLSDNVLGGVTLLRLLLHAAPLREAVGGYYQGLASVRSRGFFSDTTQYVADVLALRARFR